MKKTLQVLFSRFAIFLISLISAFGWGQQTIGSFPFMDGGFENQTAGVLG